MPLELVPRHSANLENKRILFRNFSDNSNSNNLRRFLIYVHVHTIIVNTTELIFESKYRHFPLSIFSVSYSAGIQH